MKRTRLVTPMGIDNGEDYRKYLLREKDDPYRFLHYITFRALLKNRPKILKVYGMVYVVYMVAAEIISATYCYKHRSPEDTGIRLAGRMLTFLVKLPSYISMVDVAVWVEVSYKDVELFHAAFYGTQMLRRATRKNIYRKANIMKVLVVLDVILAITVNCSSVVDKSGKRFGETFFTIDDAFGINGHYIHNTILSLEGYFMVSMVGMLIYLSVQLRLQFTILGEYVEEYFNMDITKLEDREYQAKIFHGMKFVAGHYGTIMRVKKLNIGVWKYMVLQTLVISGIFAFTYIIFIIANASPNLPKWMSIAVLAIVVYNLIIVCHCGQSISDEVVCHKFDSSSK
nr:unnamed protein product [Callosobruchus chinensis]